MTIDDAVLELCECLSFIPKSDPFQVRLGEFLVDLIGTGDQIKNQKVIEGCRVGEDGYTYDASRKVGGIVFTPEQRLRWLVTALVEDFGSWPKESFKTIRQVYCSHFAAGDGKEATYDSEAEDAVRFRPPAPIPAEPLFLAGPGDEPIDKEVALIAKAAKKLTRGGKS